MIRPRTYVQAPEGTAATVDMVVPAVLEGVELYPEKEALAARVAQRALAVRQAPMALQVRTVLASLATRLTKNPAPECSK